MENSGYKIIHSMIQWEFDSEGEGKPYSNRSIIKSIQVEGSFSGSILIEGSNSGESWAPLHSSVGTPLLFYTPGIESIREVTKYIRPVMTGKGAAKVSMLT